MKAKKKYVFSIRITATPTTTTTSKTKNKLNKRILGSTFIHISHIGEIRDVENLFVFVK